MSRTRGRQGWDKAPLYNCTPLSKVPFSLDTRARTHTHASRYLTKAFRCGQPYQQYSMLSTVVAALYLGLVVASPVKRGLPRVGGVNIAVSLVQTVCDSENPLGLGFRYRT